MPLMHGSERCHCGHARDQHLQRQREHRQTKPAGTRSSSWIDAEPQNARPKLAGCLLCSCGAFAMKRSRTL